MLTHLPSIELTADGVRRATHGRDVGAADSTAASGLGIRDMRLGDPTTHVRLTDSTGNLIAIAEPAATPGLLHPSVVLM
jgi:hypothetical protein